MLCGATECRHYPQNQSPFSGARGHVVLFSDDLTLDYDRLIDYYQLRFQIEFNFRDAKQFWGLEDFMNVKARPIANAVGLSLFMVNLSHYLLQQMRQTDTDVGILDLKSFFRAADTAIETLNCCQNHPLHLFLATHRSTRRYTRQHSPVSLAASRT